MTIIYKRILGTNKEVLEQLSKKHLTLEQINEIKELMDPEVIQKMTRYIKFLSTTKDKAMSSIINIFMCIISHYEKEDCYNFYESMNGICLQKLQHKFPEDRIIN
jgi:hypothetical protein